MKNVCGEIESSLEPPANRRLRPVEEVDGSAVLMGRAEPNDKQIIGRNLPDGVQVSTGPDQNNVEVAKKPGFITTGSINNCTYYDGEITGDQIPFRDPHIDGTMRSLSDVDVFQEAVILPVRIEKYEHEQEDDLCLAVVKNSMVDNTTIIMTENDLLTATLECSELKENLDDCCCSKHNEHIKVEVRNNKSAAANNANNACNANHTLPEATTAGLSVSNSVPGSPVAAVLETIPLVYDPRSKKLHIISVEPTKCEQPQPPLLPQQEESLPLPQDTGITSGNGNGNDANSANTAESCSEIISGDSGCGAGGALSDSITRVGTCVSLSKTDESSFSSISSLSAASAPDDINPYTCQVHLPPVLDLHHHSLSEDDCSISCNNDDDVHGAKPKRKSFTGFLPRNLFSWRSNKDPNPPVPVYNSSNWKFFGRVFPQTPTHQNANSNQDMNLTNHSQEAYQDPQHMDRTRRSDIYASSTTALILEPRPLNLPAKSVEEELRHKQEYQELIESVKKRELKEAKVRKKLMQQQLKHENQLSQAARIWNCEILPNWEIMKNHRKTRDIWWQGIPPSVRGKVWKVAIGNELNITPELYEICVSRAKDRIRMAAESASISEEEGVFLEDAPADKEASVELIKLDVSRTFPQLCIFQKGGPYYDLLHSLLGAYVCYRPDVGYVQGMSFLAAMLILNLDIEDAFICFTNLLNKPCHLAFFRLDEPMMKSYFLTYEEFFRENMPRLFNHFNKQNLSPDLYLIDWVYTLYSRSLPLDVASRVWDVFLRDGEEFLFRTALGILRMYEDILMKLDFIHLAQFLTRLPEDIRAEPLFKSIDSIRMLSEKRRFPQVLLSNTEPKVT